MADFLFSLNAVAPLFLIMLLGLILRRKAFLDDAFVAVSTKLCFNVALPCLLFISIAQSDLKQAFDARLTAFCVGGFLLYVLLLRLITPRFIREPYTYSAFIQAAFRSNYVLLGLPFIHSLVGPAGLTTAATALAFIIPLFNIMAVLVLAECQDEAGQGRKLLFKRITTNPLIIACVVGVIYSLSPLTLPLLLARPIGYISDMAVPLALISIGASLNMEGGREKMRLALVCSLLKLVALPLVGVLIAVYLGFGPLQLAVVLALFAAPPATSCFTMAHQMGADYKLTSLITVTATAISALTMFTFVFVMRVMGLL